MRIGPALRIPSPSHKRISSENRSIDTVLRLTLYKEFHIYVARVNKEIGITI